MALLTLYNVNVYIYRPLTLLRFLAALLLPLTTTGCLRLIPLLCDSGCAAATVTVRGASLTVSVVCKLVTSDCTVASLATAGGTAVSISTTLCAELLSLLLLLLLLLLCSISLRIQDHAAVAHHASAWL
jgi:hypothetical protein